MGDIPAKLELWAESNWILKSWSHRKKSKAELAVGLLSE